MKNLQEFLNEKLIVFHPQMDEELIVNKDYDVTDISSVINILNDNFNWEVLDRYTKKYKNDIIENTASTIIPDGDTNDVHYDDIEECVNEMFNEYKYIYEVEYSCDTRSLYDILEDKHCIEYDATNDTRYDGEIRIYYSRDKFEESILGLYWSEINPKGERVYIASNRKRIK